jgi:hypothetical protein
MMTIRCLASALALTAVTAVASAQPFTYQGTLDDNGSPANGVYDFQFRIGDSAVGGGLWDTVQVEDIPVADGLFTALIDFPRGMNAAFRWLQIEVRPGSSTGAYTILTPRQFLAAAPFAAVELNDPWQESVLGLAPNTVGTLSYGNGDERVFINRQDPITSSEYFGIRAPVNGFGGMYIDTGSAGLPFYGYSTAGAVQAYHYFQPNTGELIFWRGRDMLRIGDGFATLSGTLTTGDITASTVATTSMTAGNIAYSSSQPRTMSVSYTAFLPQSSAANYASLTAGIRYISDADTTFSLTAPLNLPNGAVVERIEFIGVVNQSGKALRLVLVRDEPFSSSGVSAIGDAFIQGTPSPSARFAASSTLSSLPGATVDNTRYTYRLVVEPSNSSLTLTPWTGTSNMGVRGARVIYRVTAPD